MAGRRGSGSAGNAPAERPVAERETPAAEQAAPVEPVEAADDEGSQLADLEASETTTDYTRRAGGYVLTDRGWVLGTARDGED